MSFIQTGQQWHFDSELALEEVVWRNLPHLLQVEPLQRQFNVEGKVCDLLAVDSAGQLVIIELKNTEDRYIAQQLTRYYDALRHADKLPFTADTSHPRLVAIAPSFHTDTLIDCRYSTLDIALLTFRLAATDHDITLSLHDASGTQLSALHLPEVLNVAKPEIEVPEPPRKLLNWLSHSRPEEYDWVMQMRSQILGFDPRMREVVESNRIIYGKGKSKPCCELRKERPADVAYRAISYFLWLPHPEYRPHVIRMMVNFDLAREQIRQMLYCRHSFQTSQSWNFPDRPNIMGVMRRKPCFKEHYLPLLNASNTISSTDIVGLALRTWHRRL